MNNAMVKGFYKSVKSIIQNEEQPNYDDNYTCFCGSIICIEPFDNIYDHIQQCKKYASESNFLTQFQKLNLNILKLPQLLALKAEFLLIITKIEDHLNKKHPSQRQQQQIVRKYSNPANQGQFLKKYSDKLDKISSEKQSISISQSSSLTQKCNSCGSPGDSSIEIESLQTLSICGDSFCLGCLRKQINSQFLPAEGNILCQACSKQMPNKDIEAFIGKERVNYLKTKLKTGMSPMQSTIPCTYCFRYIKQQDVLPNTRHCCKNQICQDKLKLACTKKLKCQHYCFGYKDEKTCLPCLICELKQQEQYCYICYTESLQEAPCIQALCGHIYHYNCVIERLQRKWSTFYISFGFCLCPLCKRWMEFPKDSVPQKLLSQINELNLKVRTQAQLRVGKFEDNLILTINDALDILAFYQCFKCQKPFFGGKKDCQLDLEDDKLQNPLELVCPGCCGIKFEGCKKHGSEYLEYKCRFCCNIATYFCWGTTHFCLSCHKKQSTGQYVTSIKQEDLQKCEGIGLCPIGGQHQPNGQEQCLGCGLCKNQ